MLPVPEAHPVGAAVEVGVAVGVGEAVAVGVFVGVLVAIDVVSLWTEPTCDPIKFDADSAAIGVAPLVNAGWRLRKKRIRIPMNR